MRKGRPQTLAMDESARESSGDDSGVGEGEEAEESEVRELEVEVKGMAERILHLRRTVPSRLAEALSAELAAQRPRLPLEVDVGSHDRSSQEGIAGRHHDGTSEKPEMSNRGASLQDADQEICEKLDMFRAKLSGNVDAMPNILKRINGCIARINRVDQNGIVIHPVFKKRRKIGLS